MLTEESKQNVEEGSGIEMAQGGYDSTIKVRVEDISIESALLRSLYLKVQVY